MNISPNVKPALWGAAGGAIALAISVSAGVGWVTSSTAATLADKHVIETSGAATNHKAITHNKCDEVDCLEYLNDPFFLFEGVVRYRASVQITVVLPT